MRERDLSGQTAPDLDRLTGAIVDGRYRLDEKLAAGGFGAIYRATDVVMGREVALKVLHRALARDASVVERFRREAAALARLRDPHTVTMYDCGEAPDGTRYIVMELLRGGSLHEEFHARGGRLPWRRVAAIARGVCSSLREAHGLGIVHRDLKPANIFLEQHALEADFVKVLDFGIAKQVERVGNAGASDTTEAAPGRDLTAAGQLVGTFDYMPPEQMIGGTCTGRSDVFTLGVVIYEMIAGERPYGDAKGPASMLMSLLGTTPVPLAERAAVPATLDRVVMRAIQRDPDARPDVVELDEELARILAAAELDDDEARFCDDGPTDVEPVPARAPLRRTAPRSSVSPPPRPRAVEPARTLLGAVVPTPARGVPIIPRRPAPVAKPADFAVGSRTAIPPIPPTPAPASIAPLVVRFAAPPASSPVPPARMPSGTTAPSLPASGVQVAAPATDRIARRDAWIRAVVYAVLAAAVVVAVWAMYR